MAGFLKAISGVYLTIVWMIVGVLATSPALGVTFGASQALVVILLMISGVILSIPAAVVFAVGQVVEDVRSMRNDVAAIRQYYEPEAQLDYDLEAERADLRDRSRPQLATTTSWSPSRAVET